MARGCPVATVITIGDHPVAAGLSVVQVAPVAVPQVYPHMGTTEPSGNAKVVGAAVRLTCAWATVVPAPRRRTAAALTAFVRTALR
jgi:hypothetical protein